MTSRRIDNSEILTILSSGPASSGELARALMLSRQAVLQRLITLRSDGLVRQTGRGRGARWERVFVDSLQWSLAGNPAEHEMWREVVQRFNEEFSTFTTETRQCLNYAVTEMLNNAIDHSDGTVVTFSLQCDDEAVEVVIDDDGIGAFRRVRESFDLPSEMDAIAHVAKGQQTTDPARHTGQGLYFTSRVVDYFEAASGSFVWKVDNIRDDATIGPIPARPGTRIRLRTDRRGTRRPKDVFDQFARPPVFEFDRSTYRVKLIDHGDQFVSRSEARRLAMGLELYGLVVLDFSGVREVGQGFVDELLRVWPSQHPGTEFSISNASREVAFMIDRGLPPRS